MKLGMEAVEDLVQASDAHRAAQHVEPPRAELPESRQASRQQSHGAQRRGRRTAAGATAGWWWRACRRADRRCRGQIETAHVKDGRQKCVARTDMPDQVVGLKRSKRRQVSRNGWTASAGTRSVKRQLSLSPAVSAPLLRRDWLDGGARNRARCQRAGRVAQPGSRRGAAGGFAAGRGRGSGGWRCSKNVPEARQRWVKASVKTDCKAGQL